MADVTVKVLEPATGDTAYDFLTLEEAKILLGIASGDTSQDEALKMLITMNSTTVAEMANRTFAKEKVRETWRDVGNGRLYLTHFPVKEDDIELVVAASNLVELEDYELEEASGKLSHVRVGEASSSLWPQSVIVTYTGGFTLPDEAPWPLKHATGLLIREERVSQQQASVSGIRQLSHKEARVTFFDTASTSSKGSSSGKTGARQAAENLVQQYCRHWV
jgi:hypothetical protein